MTDFVVIALSLVVFLVATGYALKTYKLSGLPVLVIVFTVVTVVGYVLNVYKLSEMTMDPITGMFVLRIIGVFLAPLGVVLGFMGEA